VHRDEYVFNKEATNRIGVGNLERLHRAANGNGFANGGYTGGSGGRGNPLSSNITFINNGTPQREVDKREEDDGNGGRRTVYVLEDAVAGAMSRHGSSARKSLSRDFGLKGRVRQA
jgi:phage-related minor tail protein